MNPWRWWKARREAHELEEYKRHIRRGLAVLQAHDGRLPDGWEKYASTEDLACVVEALAAIYDYRRRHECVPS